MATKKSANAMSAAQQRTVSNHDLPVPDRTHLRWPASRLPGRGRELTAAGSALILTEWLSG